LLLLQGNWCNILGFNIGVNMFIFRMQIKVDLASLAGLDGTRVIEVRSLVHKLTSLLNVVIALVINIDRKLSIIFLIIAFSSCWNRVKSLNWLLVQPRSFACRFRSRLNFNLKFPYRRGLARKRPKFANMLNTLIFQGFFALCCLIFTSWLSFSGPWSSLSLDPALRAYLAYHSNFSQVDLRRSKSPELALQGFCRLLPSLLQHQHHLIILPYSLLHLYHLLLVLQFDPIKFSTTFHVILMHNLSIDLQSS
jgi:hypothetical protein